MNRTLLVSAPLAVCLAAAPAFAKSKTKVYGTDFAQKSAIAFSEDDEFKNVFILDQPLTCEAAAKIDLQQGQPAGAKMIQLSNLPWKKGGGKFDGSGSKTQISFWSNKAGADNPKQPYQSENGFGTWKISSADANTAHLTLTAHTEDAKVAAVSEDFTVTVCKSEM